MNEQLYTVKEASKLLFVKETTVQSWCRKNKIEHIKLPTGVYRIRESTVNEILGKQPA